MPRASPARGGEGAGGAGGVLWGFHNAKNGLCFPSYEKIAEAAHCARSTVAEAIRALEDAGVLSWVQRIKRVRVRCPDLFGADGVRVVPQRTSNAYHFNDPGGAGAYASRLPSRRPSRRLMTFSDGA
jgi:hypothetical protein